jgi:flavin-dependent dehydrogenase
MPDGLIGSEFDAAVIGGGPAGCTVARLLASWGYSVVVIAPAHRVPERAETLPPSSRRLFRLLEVHDHIDSAGFYRTAGNTAWWGSEEPRVETYPTADGPGYQVTRGEFDRLLLNMALEAGATICHDRVRDVDMRDGAVVHLRSHAGIRARFVVDASGRSGVIARRGLRVAEPDYRTVAICGYWHSDKPDNDPSYTLIESYRDGWAWSMPVSATRRFVTVMIDVRTTKTLRGQGVAATYYAELDKTRPFKQLLAQDRLDGTPWACDASLYHATNYASPNYLLAGDAGSAVDPLSSYGVKKAMQSAWLAATVVNTCLRNTNLASTALDYFDARERQVYSDQMRQTAVHFRTVASREMHPFWTQRSEAPPETAFCTESELSRALDELKCAQSIRLKRAPCARARRVPRVRGREIVLDDALAAPQLPLGIEYLRGVDLWMLAQMAENFSQVPDLYAAYNRACPEVALPNFLSALSVLLAKGVLRNEGVATN